MRPTDLPSAKLHAPTLTAAAWRRALTVTSMALIALLGVYWESVVTVVQTWERSGTYTHGFIVLPASAWLIWRKREELAVLAPKPFLPGLLALVALSVLWLLGRLASVQTVQEFALVASIPTLLWTVWGTHIAARIVFPLAFILFAWPFGEFLVPPLIDRTADFTVAALRLTGVPVFREGNSFVIPSGDWSVVSECSGVRYLIATICGGSVFAYLTYRSWARRATFMIAAVVVTIIANWLRAYLIVLLGHVSGNKLATGVDHLIYGWVFFGLVMLLLFYVGAHWAEEDRPPDRPEGMPRSGDLSARWFSGVAAAAVALMAIGPAFAFTIQSAEHSRGTVKLRAPSAVDAWQPMPAALTSWAAPFEKPTATVTQAYRNGSQQVQLQIDVYRDQRSGSKLLTFMSTTLSDYDVHWRTSERTLLSMAAPPTQVIERRIESASQKLVTWQWFWVDGVQTTGIWRAKFAQVTAQLAGKSDASAAVTLAAPYREDASEARGQLQRFVDQMGPAISRSLDDAVAR